MADSNEDLARRARKWAAETALAQGLPVKISDPLVLRRVAEILASNKPTPNQADHVHPRSTRSRAHGRQA
jgi:hypothetical protein